MSATSYGTAVNGFTPSIGDKQMAREAAIDFGVDAAAAAVPFVPAGATKISRGGAYVLKRETKQLIRLKPYRKFEADRNQAYLW